MTKEQLWTAVLCIDHAFDSFKAANAYKADMQALTLRGNAKSNDTQEKGTSGPQLKGHPHLHNPPSNSTSINFKNNAQYKNPSPGSTQGQRNSQNTGKFNNKKADMRPFTSVSKFQSNQSRPSSDKAGNLICFKCGKIRYAQDCLNHPYKPWVFTIRVSSEGDSMNLKIIDEATEEATGDVVTKGTMEENTTLENEDHLIDDPYDNINVDIIDEDAEEHAESSLGFNMLTFINEANENYAIKLASAKQLE